MFSFGYTVDIDYKKLNRCKGIVRKQMIESKFSASQSKFDQVLERRALKLYNKS